MGELMHGGLPISMMDDLKNKVRTAAIWRSRQLTGRALDGVP